jgi:copper chaperone CopZ
MSVNEIVSNRNVGCRVSPLTKVISREQLSLACAAFLAIDGMGCPTCARRVSNGFLQIDGVLAAKVVWESALATVWYDPNVLRPDSLVSSLPAFANDSKHHYTVKLVEVFD